MKWNSVYYKKNGKWKQNHEEFTGPDGRSIMYAEVLKDGTMLYQQ